MVTIYSSPQARFVILYEGKFIVSTRALNGFSAVPSYRGTPSGNRFGFSYLFSFYETTLYSIMYFADGPCSFDVHNPHEPNQDSIHVELPSDKYYYHSWNSTGNGGGLAGDLRIIDGNASLFTCGNEISEDISGVGDDITFAGGDNDRYFNMYAFHNPPPPSQDPQYPEKSPSGIIFSFFGNNTIIVDNQTHILQKGQYFDLEEGHHIIKSIYPVSVMTLGRGMDGSDGHRWNDWGTYLSGGLLSPPLIIGKAEYFPDRYEVELLPGINENIASERLLLHHSDPGLTSIFQLTAHNIGNMNDSYVLNVTNPRIGWNFSINYPSEPVFLSPDSMFNFMIGFSSPASAKVDDWADLNVTIYSKTSGANGSITLRLVVNPVYFVRLTCNETTKYVDPGQSAIFSMIIRNEGNAPDEISLAANRTGGEIWDFNLSTRIFSLNSGDERILNLTVYCPEALAYMQTKIRVVATSKSNDSMRSVIFTRTIANLVHGFNFSVTPLSDRVLPEYERTFKILIENRGNGEEIFSLCQTGAPSEWNSGFSGKSSDDSVFQMPDGQISIGAYQEANVSLSIRPDKDSFPANYSLSILASNTTGFQKRIDINVRVLQVFGVSLDCSNTIKTVSAGATCRFVLDLGNTGNGNDTLILNQKVPKGTLRLNQTSFTLGPKKSCNAYLTIVVPAHHAEGQRKYKITAISAGDPNMTASVELTLNVKTNWSKAIWDQYFCAILAAVLLILAVTVVVIHRWKRRGR
jgi:uncharacterized membrane protein